MSSISSGFIIRLGIVECDVLRNTRSEYSVIDGSLASIEKLGALGLVEVSLGRTP